ncbi:MULTISPECIES: ATP-binding protein [unclassified Caballeronia]|uniref:ATP-binding protein n=1 Tax=unclassified Caballeronia TaxID=2646786 RepID=UPI002865B0B9|nr:MULTISPECIES: ATP-binding protein [unclassified Caballeronia]MDR5752488.1 ATP-binding protein [Caballeronia sp. LZ024]MDR5845294.1 ATP-binding protein [Caballeronia sp. LZ031]
MTADVTAHAFELFSQAERIADRSQGGLGIGLALVRSLVTAHGGSVYAWSAGPGLGSTFVVCLPYLEVTHAGVYRAEHPTAGESPSLAKDRVMVMRNGAVVATLDAAGLSKEAIIRAMGQFVECDAVPERNGNAQVSSSSANFAGIRVTLVHCLTYVSCSVLAAIAALLLAAFSGGATLDMGADYMLLSVAVVVIGGTQVSGGRPSPTGIWTAAGFLFLINALLNASGAGAGLRAIVYGALIIGVTAIAPSAGNSQS